MHVAVAIGAVLDLAALEVGDGLGHIGGDGPGLWVWHQTTRPEDPTKLAHLGHQVRGGNGDVKVQTSTLHLGQQIIGTNQIGARGTSLVGCLASGEDRHANIGAGTRGQAHGATDHLVGLAGINAQADHQLDGFVKVGRRQGAHQFDGLSRAMEGLSVEALQCVCVLLALFRHVWLPRGFTPMG